MEEIHDITYPAFIIYLANIPVKQNMAGSI